MKFLKGVGVVFVGAAVMGCGGDGDGGGNDESSSSSSSNGGSESSGGGGSTNYTAQELAAGACEQEDQSADCDIQPYIQCALDECGSEYQTCLGDDFMSGNFSGGACESYMECVTDAPDQCDHDCMLDGDCEDCFLNTLVPCIQSNCSSELSDCTGGQTVDLEGVGTGGTCEDLEACCASLSGDAQAECEMSLDQVRAAGDLGCGSVYTFYQISGECT
jgi:hypothetical protein